MATAIQKNSMKPLTNGNINHVSDVDNLENVSVCNDMENDIYKCPVDTVEETEPQPEIDILIRNVVCSFNVRCHLDLREIALNGSNVEYKREYGMITMKLRRPSTTASIWSSGKVTCVGAETEEEAKIAARRTARSLQKLGFRARFTEFRVVNVLGTCFMPWAIKVAPFSVRYKDSAEYEPELHPGVTYKLKEPRATLKIFSTGSITVTAPSVAAVGAAIEHIFPLVYEFRKKRTAEDEAALLAKKRKTRNRRYPDEYSCPSEAVDKDRVTDDEDEEMAIDSDGSWG